MNTKLVVKPYLPFLGMVKSIDHIEHGTLAGAIGADNGAHLPFQYIKTDILQRLYTAK